MRVSHITDELAWVSVLPQLPILSFFPHLSILSVIEATIGGILLHILKLTELGLPASDIYLVFLGISFSCSSIVITLLFREALSFAFEIFLVLILFYLVFCLIE